jgi:hypothetical protein
MAVVTAPRAPVSHVGGMVVAPPTIAEPAYQGLWSWFTTVDHKRIGILYGVSAGWKRWSFACSCGCPTTTW